MNKALADIFKSHLDYMRDVMSAPDRKIDYEIPLAQLEKKQPEIGTLEQYGLVNIDDSSPHHTTISATATAATLWQAFQQESTNPGSVERFWKDASSKRKPE